MMMAEKVSVVPLDKAPASHSGYIGVLLREAVPALCVNRTTGKSRMMNFKALFDNNNRFRLQSGGVWKYYLTICSLILRRGTR
jgi:hypothetical protein